MNCFQIEVRGVTFTIWAPTLREAVETFDAAKLLFEQGNIPGPEFKKAEAAYEKANRLDLRRDPGRIYEEWDELYPNW